MFPHEAWFWVFIIALLVIVLNRGAPAQPHVCPRCRTRNPRQARFCAQCGTRL